MSGLDPLLQAEVLSQRKDPEICDSETGPMWAGRARASGEQSSPGLVTFFRKLGTGVRAQADQRTGKR